MQPFGHAARARFTIAPDLDMLNHGSYGACPVSVVEAEFSERRALEADPIAAMDVVPGRVRQILEQLAPRLGARAEDLALVENATAGVNTVLRSLTLRPGDRIVTTTHVYGAVRQALHWVAARAGAEVIEVPVPFPCEGPEHVLAALSPALPGARLAVIDAITSPTGLVWPMHDLVRACRAAGVPVLVDGAHVPGQVPLDLDQLGADWFVGNLHKWLFAPKGSAVLWAAPEHHADLVPLVIGHPQPLGYPRSFDWIGTRDVSGWMAIPSALVFVDEYGEAAIRAHNHALCADMAQALAERWRVPLPAPASMRAAMAAIPAPGPVPETGAAALHAALRQRRIEVPCIPFAGRTWIRISAQIYNTPDQYERLGTAVEAILA